MNISELRQILQQEHIRADAYELNGGNLPETYTLGNADGQWYVFYSEKGLETGKRLFSSESEACKYFLGQIMRDLSTREPAATNKTLGSSRIT